MKETTKANGHIVTPEGREIASNRKDWDNLPSDYKNAGAAWFDCKHCPTPIGEIVHHPAGG